MVTTFIFRGAPGGHAPRRLLSSQSAAALRPAGRRPTASALLAGAEPRHLNAAHSHPVSPTSLHPRPH